jgi:hypothetical protein
MNWVADAFEKIDRQILSQSDLAYEAKGLFDGNPAQLKIYYWKSQKSWFAKFSFKDEEGESESDFEDEKISGLIPRVLMEFDFHVLKRRRLPQVVRNSLYHQFSCLPGEPLKRSLFEARCSEASWCLAQGYIDAPGFLLDFR